MRGRSVRRGLCRALVGADPSSTDAATVLAVAAAVVFATGCHQPPPDDGAVQAGGLAGRVAGCWELAAAEEGAAADTLRRWKEEGAVPGVVRLDTARAETGGDGDRFVAWSYVHSRKQRRPLATWRPVGDDSLRVETPGAMAGTVLRLAVEPERLVGTASVFTDVRQLGQDTAGPATVPVEARRADCPA